MEKPPSQGTAQSWTVAMVAKARVVAVMSRSWRGSVCHSQHSQCRTDVPLTPHHRRAFGLLHLVRELENLLVIDVVAIDAALSCGGGPMAMLIHHLVIHHSAVRDTVHRGQQLSLTLTHTLLRGGLLMAEAVSGLHEATAVADSASLVPQMSFVSAVSPGRYQSRLA